jgi:raffinose/stachyose/melibiose transport system permease protein
MPLVRPVTGSPTIRSSPPAGTPTEQSRPTPGPSPLAAPLRWRMPGSRESRALPYLLIAPGLAFYVLFVIIPIIGTISLSLFRWDGLTAPEWVGLDNFGEILSDQRTLESFRVAFVFVAFNCLLPVVLGLVLVAAMTRSRVRGLSVFRLIYFLPYTLALAVVAIAWRWLLATDGSVNEALRGVFGEDAVRPFLGDFTLALPALGVVALWVSFGFVLVLLLAGAQHIPKDLYDQARVDGAGAVREFFAVTLPGLRFEVSVALTMTFVFALRMFDLPLMTTQGGPGYATTTPALIMYRDVFGEGLVGEGAAIAVVLTVLIFAGVMAINRVVARD